MCVCRRRRRLRPSSWASLMNWTVLRPAQARALGRMGAWKSAPKSFIMTYGDDETTGARTTLIVVPSSSRDRRRWDVSPKGKITRRER